MNTVRSMLLVHPDGEPATSQALEACIRTCFDCAQACTACADACLAEDSAAELRKCARLNQDCADICMTTGRFLSRLSNVDGNLLKTLLMTCRDFCNTCAYECEGHADKHELCQICAQACRRCEQACQDLLPRPF